MGNEETTPTTAIEQLTNHLVNYIDYLQETEIIYGHIKFDLYTFRDMLGVFGDIERGDIACLDYILDYPNNIDEAVGSIADEEQKIVSMAFHNVEVNEIAIDRVIQLFYLSYAMLNLMLNNVRTVKIENDKPVLAVATELESYKPKYSTRFFTPSIKQYDIEMLLDTISSKLISNGDEKDRIGSRNIIYTVYKYCKLLERG